MPGVVGVHLNSGHLCHQCDSCHAISCYMTEQYWSCLDSPQKALITMISVNVVKIIDVTGHI